MTKQEIQEELTRKGIEYNRSAKKDELEALLADTTRDSISAKPALKEYSASYFSKGKTRELGVFANEKDAKEAVRKVGASVYFIKEVK